MFLAIVDDFLHILESSSRLLMVINVRACA